jgi:hypothetical protein
MSNQSLKQQSVRNITGTTSTYEGDWHALFDLSEIPTGEFNGRLLQWINQQLSSNYNNLTDAQNAYAISRGVYNWDSLGPISASFSTQSNANIIFDIQDVEGNDGDLVSEVTDKVGGVIKLTASGADRPTLRIDERGRKYLEFSGTQNMYTGTSAFTLSATNSSIVAVTDRDSFNGATNSLAILMQFNGARNYYWESTVLRLNDGSIKGQTGGELNKGSVDILTANFLSGASGLTLMQNGVLLNSAAALVGGDITEMRIGRTSGNTFGLVGKIYYIELYTTAFANQAASVVNDNRLRALQPYPQPVQGCPFLLFILNSLVEGFRKSARDKRMAELTMADIPPSQQSFVVRGMAGARTADANAASQRPQWIVPHMGTNGQDRWVIFWELTNSIYAGGQTAAQTYASLVEFFGWVKTNYPNAKTVSLTAIPRSGAFDTTRVDCNNLVLADTTEIDGLTYVKKKGVDNIDYVCDVTLLPEFNASGDETNTTYYFTDQIHTIDAGDAALSVATKEIAALAYNPQNYPEA